VKKENKSLDYTCNHVCKRKSYTDHSNHDDKDFTVDPGMNAHYSYTFKNEKQALATNEGVLSRMIK
jgi:hypothetical protein